MQLNLFAAVSTGKAGPPTVGDDANATTGDAASAASEVFAGLLAVAFFESSGADTGLSFAFEGSTSDSGSGYPPIMQW